jgi:4-amino-4-deoxy-L-arabinose transferase-like glycosyltransferase
LGASARVPAWAALAGLVVCSFLFRLWLGSKTVGPFILVDELIYADVGSSLADGGGLLVRGEAYGIASVLYPLLIAPAFLLFDALPDAYAAVKAINALLMSLAAVPAYLLARRVLPVPLSFLAAVLAVALPSLVYTGTVMTENAFYPAFLLAALLLTRVLERPTLVNQVALLAACGAAVLIRVQAAAIVLAALTAPLLLRAVARRPLRDFRLLYGIVGGGALLLALAQVARGNPLSGLLGTYAVVGESGYDVGSVLRFLLWHVAELDLYLGVFPVAALLLLTARMRSLDGPARAFLAAALALTFWIVLVVAAFASRFANAIEERNMFVVAPLLLVALLVWIDRGAVRPRGLTVAAVAVAGVLPALIPFERFIESKARSDTLMLLPLWNLQDEVTLPRVDEIVLAVGVAAALAFALVPRRYALALPLLVLGYFALALRPIDSGPHGIRIASAGAVFTGITSPHRDWIDRAVPDGAEVAVLWTGRTDRFTVNQNEFFNRSVGPVYALERTTDGNLPETRVDVDPRTGVVERESDGTAVRAEYVLTDGSIAPEGEPVARDEKRGLTVYRVGGELVSTTSVEGVYDDAWSGPEVTYRRVRCEGGTLTVTLDSDPGLFTGRQTVEATSGGNFVFVRLTPTRSVRLSIPLVPENGVCTARFTVEPTKVPGAGDDRELGVHFRAFEYTP